MEFILTECDNSAENIGIARCKETILNLLTLWSGGKGGIYTGGSTSHP